MTIPVFMLAKKIQIRSETIKRILTNLTLCGFGIYMIHYLFTGPCVLLTRVLGIPLGLQIPVAALFAFAASWGIVAFLHKVIGKNAKYLLG